jgi:hypothetical protein
MRTGLAAAARATRKTTVTTKIMTQLLDFQDVTTPLEKSELGRDQGIFPACRVLAGALAARRGIVEDAFHVVADPLGRLSWSPISVRGP